MFKILSTKEKEYEGYTAEARELTDKWGRNGWYSPVKVGEHPYRKNKDYAIPEILWVGRPKSEGAIPCGSKIKVRGKAKREHLFQHSPNYWLWVDQPSNLQIENEREQTPELQQERDTNEKTRK